MVTSIVAECLVRTAQTQATIQGIASRPVAGNPLVTKILYIQNQTTGADAAISGVAIRILRLPTHSKLPAKSWHVSTTDRVTNDFVLCAPIALPFGTRGREAEVVVADLPIAKISGVPDCTFYRMLTTNAGVLQNFVSPYKCGGALILPLASSIPSNASQNNPNEASCSVLRPGSLCSPEPQ